MSSCKGIVVTTIVGLVAANRFPGLPFLIEKSPARKFEMEAVHPAGLKHDFKKRVFSPGTT